MRLIVTRPEPQCSVWVKALQDAGLEAIACPLIDIKPLAFAWEDFKSFDTVMWVSRSAVENFQRPLPQATLHLASGLGTVESLAQYGVQAGAILSPSANSTQFDSEALWDQMQRQGLSDWTNKCVLVVRGANYKGEPIGRNWLADTLAAHGARVEFVSCYQRALPINFQVPTPSANDVWLLSSSESILHLQLLAPTQIGSRSSALCTHPRIAQAAREAGFGAASVCAPVVSAVINWGQTPIKSVSLRPS